MKQYIYFFFIFLNIAQLKAAETQTEQVDYSELDQLINSETTQYDYEYLDPYHKYNRKMLRFNMFLFRNTMLPFIYLIDAWTPKPVLTGFTNFTNNFSEPKNYLIYKFSGRHEEAKIVARRFFTNSLFGVFGLINVAERKWGDKYAHKRENFEYFFKHKGDKPGQYVIYPVINNYYHREFAASSFDWLCNPIFYFTFPFNYIYFAVDKAIILSKNKETLYQNRIYSDVVYENLRDMNTHEVHQEND